MLQLVKLALSKPYTFVVLAILILLSGGVAWETTPTDIFPDIRIPVIAAIWTYNGLPPQEMAGRIVGYYERSLPSTVNDIEHIESQSLNGVGVVKIFFQPGTDIRSATAQVTSMSQTVLKQMPPGITPPQLLNYNASTVPILQLALSSKTLSESAIFDLGNQTIKPALSTVAGAALPTPYGGKQRQIQIDINPAALQALHMSAVDVGNALAAQNQIVPAGTTKIGQYEYDFTLNNSPAVVAQLNNLPIKTVDGATVYMRDVAQVRDGSPPQTNVVRVDGRRAVLMPILKSGTTSTIDIVNQARAMLPKLEETLPAALHIEPLSDQSLFVKASVSGVIREGVIAATLTSLMILLFLGSWRSTVIIAASIPLAILAAVAALAATGQTLNVMTLGGLALAVGILVDDATVTIENINWHLENGKSVRDAILDGAEQIVGPAFVSLLCICIAFLPMFFLPGVAGFLFAPMAMAVVFAMIASFILSRTLVPTMGNYLLRDHATEHTAEIMASARRDGAGRPKTRNPLPTLSARFRTVALRGVRGYYVAVARFRARAADGCLCPASLPSVVISFALIPTAGPQFLPARWTAGQINLHVRAPVGTRHRGDGGVVRPYRGSHPRVPSRRTSSVSIVDNIGLPVSGINTGLFEQRHGVGPQDGDILITLSKEGHKAHGRLCESRSAKRCPMPSRDRPSLSCPPTSSARS